MTDERILSKIRKLLNLANDAAASEGERENAMRMAHGLLAKHNLDMAAAEASGTTVNDEPREQQESQFFGRPWARSVAQSAAKLFFCNYIYISHRDGKKVRHLFIGRRSNATTAAEMAKYLVESIMREGKTRARREGMGHTWYRSFALGAAVSIRERIHQIIAASAQQSAPVSNGRSLVLANVYDLELKANQELTCKLHPSLRTGRSGLGSGMSTGFDQGKSYGNSVSLNRQVGGSSLKRLT